MLDILSFLFLQSDEEIVGDFISDTGVVEKCFTESEGENTFIVNPDF